MSWLWELEKTTTLEHVRSLMHEHETLRASAVQMLGGIGFWPISARGAAKQAEAFLQGSASFLDEHHKERHNNPQYNKQRASMSHYRQPVKMSSAS